MRGRVKGKKWGERCSVTFPDGKHCRGLSYVTCSYCHGPHSITHVCEICRHDCRTCGKVYCPDCMEAHVMDKMCRRAA